MVINSHVHLEKLYMIDKNKLILNSKNFCINTDIEKPKAIELDKVSF